MKEPYKGAQSVQLMQEHAARTTQRLPFKIAPSTLYALGVFFFLAAIGLSIRVGNIRGDLEKERIGHEQLAPERPGFVEQSGQRQREKEAKATSAAAESEARRKNEEALKGIREFAAADAQKRLPELEGDDLSARTQAGLKLREYDAGFPALLTALTSPRASARREAANSISLSSNAPEGCGEVLLPLLEHDPDDYVREYCAYGVGRLRPDGAWDALRNAYLSETNENVREAALVGMIWLNDPQALPLLAQVVESQEPLKLRYIASYGLVYLGREHEREGFDETARDLVLSAATAATRSVDERIRANGVWMAGYYKLPAMTPILVTAVGDPTEVGPASHAVADSDQSWEVRARAAESLGRLYQLQAKARNDAVEHIVNSLVVAQAYDPEAAVRWKAEEALGRMAYNPNKWGKLRMLKPEPRDVLEGEEAREFYGGKGGEHD